MSLNCAYMASEINKKGEQLTSEEFAELDSELAEFDLLEKSVDSKGSSNKIWDNTNLSETAQAFKSRIDRKKREQEKVLSKAEESTRARHGLMLRAMMNIKRSLTDVTRIELGERFCFKLVADDWNGWPRLSIKLQDNFFPQHEYPSFQVTAHDRHSKGTIEILFDLKQPAECLSLSDGADLKRLPVSLKKCVRSYLDIIGDIVLHLENSNEPFEDGRLESKTLQEHQEEEKRPQSDLSSDVFEDDTFKEDILEALPTLDEVSLLPEK